MTARYMNDVLPTLRAWRTEGHRAALATLVFVDGSAPRPRGSQMAIREDGLAVGNLTGGCAEAAIIDEAKARIAAGTNRLLRYGKDSPYMDIRLPCGSGIDVFFDVTLPLATLELITNANRNRDAATLVIDIDARSARAVHGDQFTPRPTERARLCEPPPRILAAGKGPLVPLIAQLGTAAEFEVIVWSSEPETLEMARPHAIHAHALTTPEAFRCGKQDRWTAFLSLFHEHAWEPPLLREALASECFYVGALGSRRTAEARRTLLRDEGVDEVDIARIHGPVGLDIGAQSPPEIVLAILGQIVAQRRQRNPA